MLPRAASVLFLLTGLAMAGGVERVTAQSAANPAPSFEFPAAWTPGRYSARFRVRGEGPGGAFELETERTIVLE